MEAISSRSAKARVTEELTLRFHAASSSFKTEGGRDIPLNASGERYSHVFGSNTSPFELFVVERKIMGPCWLNITGAEVTKEEVSEAETLFQTI